MQSLERRLGLFSVVTICISSMIGSGIFVLPGIGFLTTGPSLPIAFILAAICIVPAAVSKAELATAMPTSGGTYIYIERTFGPLAGTVAGLGLYISILLKASFALVGLSAYFSVFSSFDLLPVTLSFLGAICLLNIFGIGKVSSILTFILSITIISLFALSGASFNSWDYANLNPLMPNGYMGLASATALVFVSFAGVTKIAAIAGEVKDPHKNLPRGILLSLVLVTVLYSGVAFVLASVFPNGEIAGDIKPIYTLVSKVMGNLAAIFMAIVAVLTMVNTANAGVLAGSRFPFAMSRDHLLPSFLGELHGRFLTPVRSIILSCIVIAAGIIFLDVAKIAKLASAFMIIMFIGVNISVIVLRETRPQWYRPSYKAKLYPYMQLFGILTGFGLLFSMGMLAVFAIVSIAIPGILLYYFYSSKKTTRKGVIGIKGKRHDLVETPTTSEKLSSFFELQVEAKVVVVLFGAERSPDMLIDMASSMASNSPLEVAALIELPEQADLKDLTKVPAKFRSVQRRAKAMAREKGREVRFDPIVSHDLTKSIFDISTRFHCEWLFMEWQGRSRGALTVYNPISWMKFHLRSNLAIYKDSGVRYFRQILVVLNFDENDSVVLETAGHFAKVYNASITLSKYIGPEASKSDAQINKSALNEISDQFISKTKTLILEGESDWEEIINETINYDLLIFGSRKYTFFDMFKGTYNDKLLAKSACSVLAVQGKSEGDINDKA